MTYATVVLTGEQLLLDRTPAKGQVQIEASRRVIVGGEAILTGPVRTKLDEEGRFEKEVPASDDPTLGEPFTYTVTITMSHAYWKAENVVLPASAGTVDISAIPPGQVTEYPTRAEWDAILGDTLGEIESKAGRAETAAGRAESAQGAAQHAQQAAEQAAAGVPDAVTQALDAQVPPAVGDAVAAAGIPGLATDAVSQAVVGADVPALAGGAVEIAVGAQVPDAVQQAVADVDVPALAAGAVSTEVTSQVAPLVQAAAQSASAAQASAQVAGQIVEAAATLYSPPADWAGPVSLATVETNLLAHRTLTGDTTITALPASPLPGMTVTLVLTQDATGGRTLTIPGVLAAWSVPVVVTPDAGATDVVHLLWTGAAWLVLPSAQNVGIGAGGGV